jgi:hypothetical protein
LPTDSPEPKVAQIQRIFSHQFGDDIHDMVIVHISASISHDSDSGLWWIDKQLSNYTTAIIF